MIAFYDKGNLQVNYRTEAGYTPDDIYNLSKLQKYHSQIGSGQRLMVGRPVRSRRQATPRG
jgi:hypothetical protein